MEAAVDAAFEAMPRWKFLPERERPNAATDTPLSIGYGQTNSQPSLVRRMLIWLGARPGDKVLDVGSGSGWTTALLGCLTGATGKIVAVEQVLELTVFGRENCEHAGVQNATFHQAGETIGWPPNAPYDRILVSASASKLPEELIEQLKPGGKLVLPVRNDILEIAKTTTGGLDIVRHSGFVFVPLVQP